MLSASYHIKSDIHQFIVENYFNQKKMAISCVIDILERCSHTTDDTSVLSVATHTRNNVGQRHGG